MAVYKEEKTNTWRAVYSFTLCPAITLTRVSVPPVVWTGSALSVSIPIITLFLLLIAAEK